MTSGNGLPCCRWLRTPQMGQARWTPDRLETPYRTHRDNQPPEARRRGPGKNHSVRPGGERGRAPEAQRPTIKVTPSANTQTNPREGSKPEGPRPKGAWFTRARPRRGHALKHHTPTTPTHTSGTYQTQRPIHPAIYVETQVPRPTPPNNPQHNHPTQGSVRCVCVVCVLMRAKRL